jgi:hypothetical protein
MPIKLADLRREACAITGDYLSQKRLSLAAGLSEDCVSVAEHRGSCSKWTAEKLALALTVEMGRPVQWYEIFGEDFSPVLDNYWRARREDKQGKGSL